MNETGWTELENLLELIFVMMWHVLNGFGGDFNDDVACILIIFGTS